MEITLEKIADARVLSEEMTNLENDASDALKLARLNDEVEVEVTRSNGEKQRVKQKLLWDEVWTLGADSEAGDVLRKLYPDAFAKSDLHAEKAKEFNDYTLANFGVSAKRITFMDILNIVEAMVDYKFIEKAASTVQPS